MILEYFIDKGSYIWAGGLQTDFVNVLSLSEIYTSVDVTGTLPLFHL